MIIHETYEDHIERYFAWTYERQLIWYRRMMLKAPAPWTDDPILQRGRFTNTYRELDRGTLYCKDQILPAYDSTRLALSMLLMRLITYRVFNRVSTYELVFRPIRYYRDGLGPPDWESIKEALTELQKSSAVFTGAHTVSSYGHVEGTGSKSDKVVDVLRELSDNINEITERTIALKADMVGLHRYLQSLSGIGDFLAYELITDLAYTDFVDFTEDTWANAGPGALRGLQLLYPDRTESPYDAMRRLQEAQNRYYLSMGMNLVPITPGAPTVHQVRLTLRNIEGGLCEY